ncbi:MAG: RHS repeat-associated core domain-containing protein [Saprospiraceae bacterium]
MVKFKLFLLFILLAIATSWVNGQFTTRPMIGGPHGLQANSYTGNLFYQRNDFLIPGQGIPLDITFTYNASLDSVNFGYGYGWTFNYNMQYAFDSTDIVMLRPDGRQDTFLYNNNTYYSPAGIFDTLIEYQSGLFKLKSKYGMQYFFEDANHKKLTKIQDTNGNAISISYTNSLPTQITNASGRSVSLSWFNGLLFEIEENNGPNARTTVYHYENGELFEVVDPLGQSELYEYGDNHNLQLVTDKRGDPVSIVYNGSLKVHKLITCLGELKITYYENSTFLKESSSAGNLVTSYFFDEAGRLIGLENPIGSQLEFVYDEDDNVTEFKDWNGYVYHLEYDQKGNLLSETNPFGDVTSYAYESSFNKIASLNDIKGRVTTFSYDAIGNLTGISKPAGVNLSFSYDGSGNLTSRTDANGNSTTYTYDAIGNLTSINYPVGSQSFEYDALGNLKKITDAINHHTTFSYDALNRITSITNPLGKSFTLEYDANDNIIQKTDPNGNSDNYEYDAHENLTSVTTPIGTTNYKYDNIGNLTKIIDANGNATQFTYSALNLLASETDPVGNTTHYEYDAAGNLTSQIQPNGDVTTYTYDALSRLTNRSYPGNSDFYSYDAENNLTNTYNDDINISFTYDALDRLKSKTINTWSKTILYSYDAAGNRISMTDPDGGITTYSYDANNRLITLSNPFNETTTFTYDPANRVKRQDNANGTYTIYQYDATDRLTGVFNYNSSNNVISSFSYTYDDYGNRVSMTDLNGVHSYNYDGEHRLTNVVYADGTTEAYAYDDAGNRISLEDNGNVITYSYNAGNQIQSSGSTSYTFDLNGNMTGKMENGQLTGFDYDGRNRLVQITFPDETNNKFLYDPLNNRIQLKSKNGSNKRFIHDNLNVLLELNSTNSTTARYTSSFAVDGWISMHRGGSNYFYHKDGLNSITELTDINQNLKNNYKYDVYGNIVTVNESIENPYSFTGRYREESGLLFYRMRLYDANIGVFINKDKYAGTKFKPISLNRYSYVQSNPTNFIDPHGLTPVNAFPINRNSIGISPTGPFEMTGGLYPIDPDDYDHETVRDAYYKLIKESYDKKENDTLAEEINQDRKIALSNAEATKKFIENEKEIMIRKKFKESLKDNNIYEKKIKVENNAPSGNQKPVSTNSDLASTIISIIRIQSVDPNEIIGPQGYEEDQWVSVNDVLGYTVYFENDPDFATAPAQIAEIRMPVDSHLNIYSFRLSDFGFGDFVFQVPPNSTFYSERLDVVDSLGVYVDVTAGIDITNYELFWVFESIDPATGLPPDDPFLGFLPVNDTLVTINNDTLVQQGEGFAAFTIKPISTSITGDSIKTLASIVFDDNAPLETNTWTNLIDAFAPVSNMDTLPPFSAADTITLSWSGADDVGGVGLHTYNLYVSKDGAPFYLHTENIDTTEVLFTGDIGATYGFYTLAKDYVGNKEAPQNIAEETVAFGNDTLVLVSPLSGSVQCTGGELNIQWTSAGLNTVDLELSPDGGSIYFNIGTNINAYYFFYDWPIPDSVACTNCIIRVTDEEGNILPVLSDAFSIISGIDTTFLVDSTCIPEDTGTFIENLIGQSGCDSVIVTTILLESGTPETCNGLDDDCDGNPESVVNTWTGFGDGYYWVDPANWSDGLVPLPCQDVEIPGGSIVIVLAGQTAVGKTLHVAIDALLLVEETAIFSIKN